MNFTRRQKLGLAIGGVGAALFAAALIPHFLSPVFLVPAFALCAVGRLTYGLPVGAADIRTHEGLPGLNVPTVNPASGCLMVGAVDTQGNPYGTARPLSFGSDRNDTFN